MKEELRARARAVIDGNLYMVLATVGPDGAPWASPVFYATEDGRDFYWMSSPEVTHSRNVAHEPRVSIVLHDSTAKVGTAAPLALYLSARAEELDGDGIPEALRVYPGDPSRGGRPPAPEAVRAPGKWRMYRARVTEYSVICPRDGGPCAEHGLDHEHRTTLEL
ncbi:hypothetical protein SRB5_05950 [Streptomyces sp. RB5]|uniref:Pyridoxamine 5'-phosphate oxidase N-terminal domain-containing protein n=1 Tax=Streptomyces smaragdinus TaxID=2585196 RepID=A0A7K0CAK8_9ACTN|nr:pyridoxamine 5'-phosphate oxidase family protein [Streptomyces smaragdinus]MQY10487.1 hypothetical protein [Streptomyces smaragdinus]